MKKSIVIILILFEMVVAQSPQWIIYNTSNSQLPSNEIDHIVVDKNNRKWVSFWYDGILKIENENWTLYDTSNSNIPSHIIYSINVDHDLNLWTGGYNDIGSLRLTKFDGVDWTTWNSSNSPIPERTVMSILFDQTGDTWLICTGDTYATNYVLELTQDSVWNSHTSFTTYAGHRQMLFDRNQILWIGDWHGLYKYDGNMLTYIQGHPGQYCTDIEQDSTGNIWIATGLAGWGCLVKYDGISFTSYPNIQAICIEIDTTGNVWVGTESSSNDAELIKYDGSNWVTYNQYNSQLPATSRIFDIAVDRFGNLWIGTEGSGLVVFNETGIITPVELQNFSAEILKDNIHLTWSTATEKNNSGFEIERLKDPNVERLNIWQSIGFIEGHGTTTDPKYYSFIDQSLEEGKYQYRLKQIDFDGSYEYSNIVEITIAAPKEFTLSQNFPNPFNPTTKIKFQIPQTTSPLPGGVRGGFVTLKVYDLLGREVATLVNDEKPSGSYEVEFNGSNLSSGVYYLKLSSGGFSEIKKMVLVK